MKLYELVMRYKKTITITLSLLILLSITYIVYASNKNPFGEQVTINDLSSFSNGPKPDKETLFIMQHELFSTIQRNNPNNSNIVSLKDISVRKDSYSQEYDKEKGIHDVKLIVDIPSLSQSYLVQYQWIDAGKDMQIDQYGIMISCLPEDRLTLGIFRCEDLSSDMSGTTNPMILIDWYAARDNLGNTIDGQLQPYEISFIESQILGDYMKNNTIQRNTINAVVADPVVRDVQNDVNSLSFTILVDGSYKYQVSIDYNDGRHNKIVNSATGLVIERKTE